MPKKICEGCGEYKVFKNRGTKRRFCSNQCRILANTPGSGSKKCSKCNKILDKSYFSLRKNYLSGQIRLSSNCKTCVYLSYERYKNYTDEELKLKTRFQSRIERKLSTALYSSKRRKKENNLDLVYLLDLYEKQKGLCKYTGLELNSEFYQNKFGVPSIDRINSDIGYLKGNIVICFDYVNSAKNDLSVPLFIEMCRQITYFTIDKEL